MPASQEIVAKYKPTIGIETHVQLKSQTKLFAAVGNDARGAQPNTLISHICVGLPGALPVLNQGALKLAARAAFALGTSPQKNSHFDRKHYFYPDLPKGYQITQFSEPIIADGSVEIEVDGQKKSVKITRAHLEEDAGKNIHPEGADYTLVDLNRAGTPLLEIVSEPEINSPAEAKVFARELYLLMKYAGVSDVDLYHGNMRFDVNISVSKSDQKGIRTEIKNLNSFRNVENAVAYEISRQIEVLESGQEITQETRGWDEAKQKTTSQRGKEEAHDYRYFQDPDIPPLELSEEFIADVKQDLPALPPEIRKKLNQLSISASVIEDILDRSAICKQVIRQIGEGDPDSAKRLIFWLLQATSSKDEQMDEDEKPVSINSEHVKKLSGMVDSGSLNSNTAQTVFNEMLVTNGDPAEIAESKNLMQVSDEAEIETVVKEVIDNNPAAAADIRGGETKAIGFLVGQVMAASKGKANPQLAQEIIKKQLGL
jgi:aspartyl-tRNA(Asn)/glutamyl-tRNA(Gln) amidotransferase subunit B